MPWYIGIGFNSLFFTALWALSTKYFSTSKSQFILQLCLIPVILGVNFWYGKSVAGAASNGVSLFTVTIFSTVLSFILSLAVGYFFLRQPVSWMQLAGAALVLGGVVLLKL